MLIVARLFYGYLGGFRQKVRILKGPEKRIGNKVIIVGSVLYFLFSWFYLAQSYYSISLSDEYMSGLIYKYALENDETVRSVYVWID